ncbi:DUF4407 domain-containing protein [Streptomyces sp. NPDC048425]|uniref:DUF4407 domain-containing protein n=1 Tax=Streptomyces sp. NPDC048425 TaxID=3365548 RepID=UPI0037115D55
MPADHTDASSGTETVRQRPLARLGAFSRRLIGVDEQLMDYVPSERGRYARYGLIVVNTALLGGLSMMIALGIFLPGTSWPLLLLVAAVWGWILFVLDSWMVAGSHGYAGGAAVLRLLPRLALSVILSVLIAEPLLFHVFGRELRQEMAVAREERIAAETGLWKRCNPADGSDGPAAGCGDHQLAVAGSPAALADDIAANERAASALARRIDGEDKKLQTKNATERRECARDKWINFGGVWDVSETCKRARADTSEFKAESQLDEYRSKHAALVAKGERLAERRENAAGGYRKLRDKAITADIAEFTRSQESDGLLLRADALHKVAGNSGFAFFLVVVLHLILIAVDAMPILAKLMSGPSAYDKLLRVREEADLRRHREELDVRLAELDAEYGTRREEARLREAASRDQLEHTYRMDRTERERLRREELDERTERLLGAGD